MLQLLLYSIVTLSVPFQILEPDDIWSLYDSVEDYSG